MIALALTLALSTAAVPQDASAPRYEMTVEPLGGGCYRVHYAGANLGVYMGSDGILLVDSGYLRGAPEVEQELARLWGEWSREHGGDASEKPAELPIRYLVNTHFHSDHSGANAWFGLAGAQVVAHESVRGRLAGDPAIEDRKVLDPPIDPEGLPALTFRDSLTLHFNGGPVELLHLPLAHTDGDCVVWVPDAKVLFAGDLYNSQSFPYIELAVGARPASLIAAHERLLALLPEGARVVPGHGPAGDDVDLREFAAMIADCDRQMRLAIEEEKDLPTLYDQRLFGEYEDRWAGGSGQRAKGFIQILWYCYAPRSQRGLGELEAERARGGGR